MNLKPHELVKIFRLRKGLTQEGMALLIECSQMHISRIERGMEPKDEDKVKIENLFGKEIWTGRKG